MVSFYKHHIPDWMNGTEGLSDGAYRAYHVICQLVYLNEGPITLNERGIAGRCNQRVDRFRVYLDELLTKFKVTSQEGLLMVKRCSQELHSIDMNRSNAALGGKARANSLKSNDEGLAPLADSYALKEKTREEKTRKKGSAQVATLPTPISELSKVLDAEHAKAVIDHRQKLRKPLTARAALLLAAKLAASPNPNAAADTMIERGWAGFDQSWGQKQWGPQRVPGDGSVDAFGITVESVN